MRSTSVSAVLLALVATAFAVGCRKERDATRPGTTGGATHLPDAAAPVEAGPGVPGAPDRNLVPEPEPDWAGLSDEETAERSGLSTEDCRLALAEGDGFRISVCDFIREVNAVPSRHRVRYDSLERRKELLDEMISLAVMELEARRLGIDRDPETQFYLEKLLGEKMETRLRAEIRQRIREGIAPEDERAYFEANRDRFDRPELMSASHIVVATEDEARALLAELQAPEAPPNLFERLATEKSLDEDTRGRGGSLSFFTWPGVESERYQSIDPAIAEAVFALRRVGDLHPEPIRTEAGWHVVRMTGRRALIERTLEQVRAAVRAGIEEERFQPEWDRRMAEIESSLGVERHPENLADVRPRVPSPEDLERMHAAAHGHEGRALEAPNVPPPFSPAVRGPLPPAPGIP
jgi:hypothetical protein